MSVCIKQTVDTEAEVRVDSEGRVSTEGQTLVIDPYSEFAVERAVQLKEEHGGEVFVVCVGGDESMPAVRHALSMGADAGYLIDDPALCDIDGAAKARVLSAALDRLSVDLVLAGANPPTRRARRPCRALPSFAACRAVQVVTELTVDVAGATVRATREIDDGVALVDVALPAVVTAQQGLAEPRYPNVRSIMQSKKKPVTVWTLADISVDQAEVVEAESRTACCAIARSPPVREGASSKAKRLPRWFAPRWICWLAKPRSCRTKGEVTDGRNLGLRGAERRFVSARDV